ncbi:hypothetical protein UFOVP143_41 [uncultured Caudovirales phage]|uniref:Uncharacterized protein n=1 Tax=uncultured Caudovirales phage TaxID=2100421 RepID=A0A6J7VP04_9CAUD|nr:hypothetical protein UFOVP143_41 [uncultured Caudovirales phage]
MSTTSDILARLQGNGDAWAFSEVIAEIEQLRAALQHFIEVVPEPTDSNCSCHISPPCSDCLENSALREAFADARKLLGEL